MNNPINWQPFVCKKSKNVGIKFLYVETMCYSYIFVGDPLETMRCSFAIKLFTFTY